MNNFKILFIIATLCIFNFAKAQYCITGLGGAGCSATDQITGVEIIGTTLSNLSNTCTGTTTNTLTVFPASGTTTADLIQGVSYDLAVTTSANNIISVWIDYDHSFTYDATEWLQVCTTSTPGGTTTLNIPIPFSSLIGPTGMRIRSRLNGNQNGAGDACLSFGSGEAEDYTITIVANTPCSGTPSAGSAVSSSPAICPNINFSVSLSGSTLASGLSYQWQSSSNNINWNNIIGATNISYAATQTANTYYRCTVNCASASDTSASVLVTTNSFASCYCTSGATSTGDDDIGNVTFGALNNGTAVPATSNPTSVNTYSNFSSLPVQTYLQGITYPISITQINLNGFYQAQVYVYIDYDHDGIYDPNTENVFNGITVTGSGGNTLTGNVTIPLTSLSGNTGMRVVLVEGTFNTVSPCGTYTWGETEDYIVNIIMATPCVAPVNAGAASTSSLSVCPNIPFNLNLIGSAAASGLSYQWQESPNGTSWSNISGATTINYTTSTVTNTFYQCIVTCSGVPSTSLPIQVNVNSFFNCYCSSGATSTADDDIGNVTFGLLNNGVASPLTQNSTSVNTYSDFTNLPPFTYIQSLTYPIEITQIDLNGFYVCSIAVFIDYDHDGVFDPSTELVFDGVTSSGQNTIAGTVTIPTTSQFGITRMRVVLREGTTSPSPCGTYTWGETEDYMINILTPNSCSIPFIAGFAKTNSTPVCATDIFSLSIDSLPPDTGFTFQWQHSFDNVTWSNITGATAQIYNGSQNFDSWYRCNVTCNGGTTVSSSAVQVLNKSVTLCNYCNETISGNCLTSYFIDSVAIGNTTLNNANSGCAANAGFAYSKYPISGNTTCDLGIGNYYDMLVKTAGSCNISVWIDYDQSGTFDLEEWSQVSQATDSAVVATVPLVIPASAKMGTTGLRIRSRKTGNINLGLDACSSYGSGETEDYYVTLVSAISTGHELRNDKNLRIYPNPTTGIVSMDFRADESRSLQVKLMNPEGQVIAHETEVNFKGTYTKSFDLSTYSKGIYFVQFITDANVFTRKIILN